MSYGHGISLRFMMFVCQTEIKLLESDVVIDLIYKYILQLLTTK